MKGFFGIGLSYENTSIEVREQVAFSEQESADFLIRLKDTFSIEEALLISTCNRTELYINASEETNRQQILHFLIACKTLEVKSFQDYFETFESTEAVRRLFQVSLGLKSQVLGDIQISNQVKKAYQLSSDQQLAGPFLHRLMHTIFFAHKRVVQETRLQDGTASVASVATEVIKTFNSKIENPKVALIGLGEIGQNVLTNIRALEATFTLVNRTKEKAESFAKELGYKVGDFDNIKDVIQENDVIICAASVSNPLITKSLVPEDASHKLFIDLSVPRAIETEIEEISGIALHNVDQLNERTLKAKKVREAAIPQVERIIEETLVDFTKWKEEFQVSPTINKLKKALDQIRVEELARHSKLSDNEKELLEVVTKNMIQKVIKLPVLQLKAACKRGEADTLVEVLNDLFNLEAADVASKS